MFDSVFITFATKLSFYLIPPVSLGFYPISLRSSTSAQRHLTGVVLALNRLLGSDRAGHFVLPNLAVIGERLTCVLYFQNLD